MVVRERDRQVPADGFRTNSAACAARSTGVMPGFTAGRRGARRTSKTFATETPRAGGWRSKTSRQRRVGRADGQGGMWRKCGRPSRPRQSLSQGRLHPDPAFRAPRASSPRIPCCSYTTKHIVEYQMVSPFLGQGPQYGKAGKRGKLPLEHARVLKTALPQLAFLQRSRQTMALLMPCAAGYHHLEKRTRTSKNPRSLRNLKGNGRLQRACRRVLWAHDGAVLNVGDHRLVLRAAAASAVATASTWPFAVLLRRSARRGAAIGRPILWRSAPPDATPADGK
jgi:hypothetical protein